MSTTDSSNATNGIEDARRHLLDGLMASDATAWEHSLYRTRLYAGYKSPTDSWVPRAHASMRERAGKWGVAPGEMHGAKDENGKPREAPTNSQVARAYAAITNKKWWERNRSQFGLAKDGPYTPFETKCLDNFPAEREPAKSSLAYAAIKSLSLHVSPLGPERELALCRVWFRVGRDNILVGTRKDWAGWLGCKTEKWAVQWLRDFEAANVGVALEVLPPPAHEKAKLYVVRLSLPPIEHLIRPSGGRRRQEEDAAYELFTTALSKLPKPSGLGFVDGPSGKMVEAQAVDEDHDKHLPGEFLNPVKAPTEEEAAQLDPEDGGTVKSERDAVESETPDVVENGDAAVGLAPPETVEVAVGDEARPLEDAAAPETSIVPDVEAATSSRDEAEPLEDGATPQTDTEPEPDEVSDAEAPELSPEAEKMLAHLNKRLADAAGANAAGDHERAGEILRPVLAAVPTHIAPALFAGDEAVARSGIAEAFKRGQERVGGAVTRTEDDWAVDYLLESEKPHTARLALEGEPAPAAAIGSGPSRPKRKAPAVTDEATDRMPLPTGRVENYGHEDLPEGVGEEPADALLKPSVAPEPDPSMVAEGVDIVLDVSPVVVGRGDKPEPEVIGAQLTLDGSNGRELVRRASGRPTYPKPASKPKAKSATFPTPEVLEAMRVVGVVFDEDETVSVASGPAPKRVARPRAH
jgi:hypothetical protein